MTMKTSITILLLLIAWNMQSQNFKEIEIDSISKAAKQTIPFDEPITFKIPVVKKPKAVFIIPYKSGRQLEKALLKSSTLESSFEYKVIDNKNYVFVKHGSITDSRKNLTPSSYVSILLIETSEIGFEIMRYFHSKEMTKVDSLLKKLIEQNPWEIEPPVIFVPENHGDDSLIKLGQKLKPLFDRLDTIDKKLDSIGHLSYNPLKSEYPCLCDFVCLDSCVQTNSLDSGVVQLLSKLPLLMSTEYLISTAHGEKKFSDLFSLELTTLDNKTRLSNLLSSSKEIERYKQLLTMLTLCHPDSCLIQMIEEIGRLKNRITHYAQLITIRNNSESEIRKLIEESMIFLKVQIASGTTDIYNMKTRSSFRINPDFGLVYYGFQKDFWGLSPYAGIQINIRSINKDLPFRAYWRKPHSLLSFSLGYSINQLKADNKRTDFFTKGSLMTGAGIKFCQSVRVTTGAMWFYAENPNPVITKKELKYTPYLGLSVDLSIAELLQDFKSLVTNSPF